MKANLVLLRVVFSIAELMLILLVPAPQFKVCPNYWKGYKDKCYILLTDKRSWYNARADCKMEGADLAAPNSQAEQDFLNSLILYASE